MATDYNFQGKVIALTGGASGIGLATSILLAAAGAKLSIADVQEAQLKIASKEIEAAAAKSGKGGQLLTSIVDVRKADQVNAWIKETVETFGAKLDGAANLAGVVPKNIGKDRIEDITDDEEFKFIMDVNLNGVMYCMRAQIRNMNQEGSIVNAASVAGIIGFTKNSAYTASKHAVIGLSRTAAKEVGDRGIRVNCLCPGVIETPMQKQSTASRGTDFPILSAIKRKGEPEETAQLIAFFLSDGSKYISGTAPTIDGAWLC
ncbi:hypothetical protein AJ80_03646 [Polytolypa hystricis UAMH7299]|uniref:3-oxoacyl-[acyl-carrier-protein] reductase n=1 Tax=Polytolypa hystricis (strain UAMH7299) TaxID=1447883 RepID=A0A2B7YHJ4_POLH7|nr:hypothetical protein AJ80_03646 [Polytolypa hystricis UAMH7299]